MGRYKAWFQAMERHQRRGGIDAGLIPGLCSRHDDVKLLKLLLPHLPSSWLMQRSSGKIAMLVISVNGSVIYNNSRSRDS